jgi:hypothetical protein
MSKTSKEIEDQWDLYINSIARGDRKAADAALSKIEKLKKGISK